MMRRPCVHGLAALGCLIGVAADAAGLKRDETAQVYPTMAWPTPGGGWDLEVRARVFEIEPRRVTLGALQLALGVGEIQLRGDEAARFRSRARLFLVDGERRKRLELRLGETRWPLPPTDAAGWTSATLHTPALPGITGSGGERRTLTLAPSRNDPRAFRAEVHFAGDRGWTVVSDIDDTLKESSVLDRRELVANTFWRPFRAVDGMAALYRSWAGRYGAVFHYLSGSPWPLYPDLADFVRDQGFPGGSWHLRDFRWRPGTLLELAGGVGDHKRAVLEQLVARWPHRRFVLVGDSGEQDPEIYGDLARRHPARVARILIRDVTGEPRDAARYQAALAGVPGAHWHLFKTPAALDTLEFEDPADPAAPASGPDPPP